MNHLPFDQVAPSNCSPALHSLFDPGLPAALRCLAVLEGNAAGRVFTDDPLNPTWAVVQEAGFGTIYPGVDLPPSALSHLIADLRLQGDVLIGLWPDDARLNQLPPDADYNGWVVEFSQRDPSIQPFPPVPDDLALRLIDPDLFERLAGRRLYTAIFGSADAALQKGFGLCLLRPSPVGDKLLCEAFAGPRLQGTIEVGVETREDYRRRGYGTITCAALIEQCERQGFITYWNCAKSNQASLSLAHKLGYRGGQEYRLLAWTGISSL